jgi:hypothetical protein
MTGPARKPRTKAAPPASPVGTQHRPRPPPVAPPGEDEAVPTLPTSSAAVPSALVLLDSSKLTTDEWYRSAKMTKAYSAYVKSGKQFLSSWAEGESAHVPSVEHPSMDPEDQSLFAGAFDTNMDFKVLKIC